jgi:hypothetical protein
MLHSCLEDGDYARELFERIFAQVHPLFAASLAAAAAQGDLLPGRPASANAFWFAQHVAVMAACFLLPAAGCVPYAGTIDDVVDEASWFILRGLGMKDEAIAAALDRASLCAGEKSGF